MTKPHVFEADLSAESNLDEFFAGSMVVVRTEFFRTKDIQQDLEKIILPDLLSTSTKRIQRLKIWSAGCSEGREPYSIAAIVHHWMQENKLYRKIDFRASDINTNMINAAKKGVYEYREKDKTKIIGWKDYITVENNYILVNHVLKNIVMFYKEDILHTQLNEQQDIIICTNVLLYYNREFRKTIVEKLSRRLKTGGYLYLESMGRRFMSSVGFKRLSPHSHFFIKKI